MGLDTSRRPGCVLALISLFCGFSALPPLFPLRHRGRQIPFFMCFLPSSMNIILTPTFTKVNIITGFHMETLWKEVLSAYHKILIFYTFFFFKISREHLAVTKNEKKRKKTLQSRKQPAAPKNVIFRHNVERIQIFLQKVSFSIIRIRHHSNIFY